MTTLIPEVYPFGPLASFMDLKDRLNKKIKEVNSFNNSNNNIDGMITYFEDRINKSRKKKLYINSNLNFRISRHSRCYCSTTTSVKLSVTGVGLLVLPKSAWIACDSSLGKKLIQKIINNHNNKHKSNTRNVNKLLNILMFSKKGNTN